MLVVVGDDEAEGEVKRRGIMPYDRSIIGGRSVIFSEIVGDVVLGEERIGKGWRSR